MSRQMRDFHSILISSLNLTEEEILGWVSSNYNPEEVFITSTLDEWATENDYIKKEEQ
jgi:hypothetical protein